MCDSRGIPPSWLGSTTPFGAPVMSSRKRLALHPPQLLAGRGESLSSAARADSGHWGLVRSENAFGRDDGGEMAASAHC